VSAEPILRIGGDENDESTSFGAITGATKLPDGRIVVGDRGTYNIRVFSPAGKPTEQLGRKGKGPGEIEFLARLYRCGNSLITFDIENGYRTNVYGLDLKYRREFRFSAPGTGGPPYQYECNAAERFLQYGWTERTAFKEGAFRPPVPFWYTAANATPGVKFADFPGSERWGTKWPDGTFGSRPLPFGKQALIAIGASHGYVTTGDAYEIMVFDLAGKRVGTIRDTGTPAPRTSADLNAEIDRFLAESAKRTRTEAEQYYATFALPQTLPSYSAMRVDANDLLWARDFPRAPSKTVRWSVFSSDGKLVGRVNLPVALEVYEIGKDYVLGQYLDAEAAIPEVRMYRLTR
jgi:hypothetical protein